MFQIKLSTKKISGKISSSFVVTKLKAGQNLGKK